MPYRKLAPGEEVIPFAANEHVVGYGGPMTAVPARGYRPLRPNEEVIPFGQSEIEGQPSPPGLEPAQPGLIQRAGSVLKSFFSAEPVREFSPPAEDVARVMTGVAGQARERLSALGQNLSAEPAHEFSPAAEDVARMVPYVAPFPGVVKALTAPEQVTAQERQRGLETLLNPFPEIVTDAFHKATEGAEALGRYLGLEGGGKFAADVIVNLPFLREALPAAKMGLQEGARRLGLGFSMREPGPRQPSWRMRPADEAEFARMARSATDKHLDAVLRRMDMGDPRYQIYRQEQARRQSGGVAEPIPPAPEPTPQAPPGEVRLPPPPESAAASARAPRPQPPAPAPQGFTRIPPETPVLPLATPEPAAPAQPTAPAGFTQIPPETPILPLSAKTPAEKTPTTAPGSTISPRPRPEAQDVTEPQPEPTLAPQAVDLARSLPAIELEGGEIVSGQRGSTHGDIYNALSPAQQSRIASPTGWVDQSDNFYKDITALRAGQISKPAEKPAPTRRVKGPDGGLIEVPVEAPAVPSREDAKAKAAERVREKREAAAAETTGTYDPVQAQAIYQAFKRNLTAALNKKDWAKVLEEEKKFNDYYENSKVPFPDDWSRWQRAGDDARLALQRQEKPSIFNRPPPGGWTEADKVPEDYKKITAQEVETRLGMTLFEANRQGLIESVGGLRYVLTNKGREYQPKPEEPARLMDIPVQLIDSKIDADNIKYEIYTASDNTGRGVVRQIDRDSGNTITIKAYPNARAARAYYDTLGVTKGGPRPVGTSGYEDRLEEGRLKAQELAKLQGRVNTVVWKDQTMSTYSMADRYANGEIHAVDIENAKAQIVGEGEPSEARQPIKGPPGVDVREPTGVSERISQLEQVGRTGESARPQAPVSPGPSGAIEERGRERAGGISSSGRVGAGAERRPGDVGQPTGAAALRGTEEGVREVRGKGVGEPKRPGPAPTVSTDIARQNHILPKDEDFIPSGNRARVRANLDAIKLLKQLEAENRLATPEEKTILAKYVGWGGLKEVFDEGKAAYRRRPGWTEEQRQEAANFEKNWGKLYDEVKAELTAEERADAARSILNAHYTSREVVSEMWQAVERMGFKSGDALEPAAGIGHFIGLVPDAIRERTNFRAVELDSVSARIAKKLYPESRVEEIGFEEAKIPVNSQDLVITNIPFAAEGPRTKTNPQNLSLHNFFISRGIDLLKPGRIMAVITSDSTMDNAASAKARQIIAEKADLVAAIRLPNTTFKKNAGTEVTTDILFFRKKDGTAFQGEDFKRVAEAQTYKGEPVEINEYFVKYPEMMLGRMSKEGTMYRGGQQALLPTPGADLTQQLKDAIAKLPSNVVGGGVVEKPTQSIYATSESKIGGMIERDGKIKLIGPDKELIDPEWANNPKKVAQAKTYIGIRDLTTKLIDLQLSPEATEADIAVVRRSLNRDYDIYVRKYGPINERPSSFLDDDIDFPLAMALEDDVTRLEETRRGGKTITRRVTDWKKSKLFSERTLFPREAPDSIDTIPDALQVSMNYRGRVEPEYIAELTKQPLEKVKTELVSGGDAFENPVNGLWESRAEYLSGFVKQKLEEARTAAADDSRFQKNVTELENVQPKAISIDNIGFKLGARWIPHEAIENFIKDTLDVRAVVSLTPETGDWHVIPRSGEYSELNRTVHGIHGLTGTKLVEESLNLKSAKVLKAEERTREDGTTYTTMVRDPAKSLEAEQKQAQLQKLFKDYIRKSPELAKEVEDIYNDQFNGVVAPKFEPPTWAHYPNATNDITLYEHQKAVVTRMLQNSTLLAHAVGTGKTWAMTTAAMELRRLGLAKKPMIVVQNATLEQFARSFKRLYPAARILAPNAKQRDAINRNKTMSRIATGNWDAVIVPQSFVNMLPDNPQRSAQFIQDRISELETAKIEANKREGRRSPKAADLQKAINRLQNRLHELQSRKQDKGLTFEQLGVDALFTDEAHAYKKLEFSTKMDNIKGLDTSASQRGLSMFMKVRWIQEKNQGRNVTFATGTPVSNTLAEAWNMMRYVRPDVLKKYGIEDFDSFAATFGDTITEPEMTAGGTWKIVTRFARFANGPELIAAWRTVADVVTPEEVNLKGLPAVKGGGPRHVVVDQSPELQNYIDYLRSELERFANMKGREKRENSHIPLVVFGLAKKASLDMRMIDPSLPDQPGNKLNRAADEVFRIYKESEPVKGTQMIFSDSYQNDPANPQFNLYTELKKKLMARGIPEHEIAIINADMKDAKREALFERVNAGQTRVIIGSTERMGVGVNAQEKLIALHHLDAPPRPMDIEQRNGRILRQGNTNPTIEIVNYGVRDTLDAAMYQKLATKQKFINQILRGEISGRYFEDPANEQSLTFEEQMAAFSGDQRAIEKVGLENQVRQLEGLRKGHAEQIRKARDTLADLKSRGIPSTQHLLDQADRRSAEFAKAFPVDAEPRLTLKGIAYDGRKAVVEAVDKYVKNVLAEVKKKEGEFGQFKREYEDLNLNGKDIHTTLLIPATTSGLRNFEDAAFEWRFIGTNVAPGRFKTGQGLLQGLSSQLEAIDRTPKLLRDDLAGKERSVRELSTFIEKPFERESELTSAKDRLNTLTEELKNEGEKPRPTPIAAAKTQESFDAISAANQAEVQEARTQEKQRGSIFLPSRRKKPDTPIITSSPAVDAVLRPQAVQDMRDVFADIRERFLRVFEYEHEVKDNPQFVDALRRFQAQRQRAFRDAANDIDGVVGKLKTRRELLVFSAIVQLRDMVSRLKSGQKVQGGIDLEQAETALNGLVSESPPLITDAVDKHFRLVRAIGQDKVDRGWMAEDAIRDDYFRHRVLMYEQGRARVGKPSRIRVPGKEKAAKGSTLPIERDYLKVMLDYIAEHRFKKALDDFIDDQAKKLDMSKDVKAAMGEGYKLRPGQIVEIDGKRIKGFQFDPGNYVYPEITEVDAAVNHGIKKELEKVSLEDIDRMGEGGEPKTTMRTKLVIGRKKPTYALPLNVANRLERFSGPNIDSEFIRAINRATGKWKGLTIGFGGTAFQLMNFSGDIANIGRADMGSINYLPKAAKTLLSNDIDSKLLIKLAEELDVINSGFIGSEVTRLLETPEFRRFNPKWRKVANVPGFVSDRYLAASEYRENTPRLALFLANVARIQGGEKAVLAELKKVVPGENLGAALEKLPLREPLKTAEIDVSELAPIYGAAKVAREIPVDYGKFTPDENKYLRGLLLPFYSWTKHNTAGWARFARKRPGKLAAIVLAPWALMELWNNLMFPDDEDGLRTYLRQHPHIITGYRDESGKMIVLDLGGFPAAAAARVFGLEGVPSHLARLMRGKLTLSQTARKLMGEIASSPVTTFTDLLTPFLKIPYEVGTNKILFSGAKIVPQAKVGTDEETKLKARYVREGLFRPAREARTIMQQIEEERLDPLSSRYMLGLPLRRSGGEGWVEQFYDLYRDAQQAKKTEALYKRERQLEKRKQYREQYQQEIRLANRLRQTADKLAQLRRVRDIVRESKDLTPKAKKLRTDALMLRMAEYAKQAVEREGKRAVNE